MKNKINKFYYSPLSIGAILLIGWGIWILIAMLKGDYPTYLVFILPVLGVIILGLDNYIRKSKLNRKNKILIQITNIIFIVTVGYFLFKGQ